MEKQPALLENGFSLIEILLVISLMVIILSLATPNLFNPLGQEKVNSLASDITINLKDAQIKAMYSETLGQAATAEFGVHFSTSSYTLFRGTVFNPADTNNFSVTLTNGLSINLNLPCLSSPNDCNNIIFSKLSGEVQNFDQTKNSLCLTDTLNNRILLTTNFLGVINAQTDAC